MIERRMNRRQQEGRKGGRKKEALVRLQCIVYVVCVLLEPVLHNVAWLQSLTGRLFWLGLFSPFEVRAKVRGIYTR